MFRLLIALSIISLSIASYDSYAKPSYPTQVRVWPGKKSWSGYAKGHQAKEVVVKSCGHSSPCKQPTGLFEDQYDCCSFYNCYKCEPHHQPCALGTQFDEYQKKCVFPYESSCQAPNKDTCHIEKKQKFKQTLKKGGW